MIYRAWFEEFKALRRVSVDLEPLTVFVGPNGAGKTSVLEGIHYSLRLVGESIREVLTGSQRADRLRNARAEGPMKLGVSFNLEGSETLELVVTPTGVDTDHPYQAELAVRAGDHTQTWDASKVGRSRAGAEFDDLKRRAQGAFFLRLSPRSLAEPSYLETELPELESSGAGLASVIHDLAGNQPERKEAITAALQRVVPAVRRIRTENAKVRRRETEFITIDGQKIERHRDVEHWGSRVLLDMTGGDSIPLHAASEGTALALGLMTVLHGRRRPRTLLLDDLDRALHPKAQQDLVSVLRTVMKDDPDLQILATSHSPFLLNALTHREVRVNTLTDDGSVLCGSLLEHPDFDRWKALVKPGEFWTAELEDWLRKKRAA